VSELVGLVVKDLDMKAGRFRVTRKGGNQEILYMPPELKEQLELFLTGSLDGDGGPLFLSMQKKRMTVRAVQYVIEKYGNQVARLKNISPHKLRSTFGTNLYRETGDIFMVANVLGHEDVNTTKKHYAAIDEDIKKEAAKRVKIDQR